MQTKRQVVPISIAMPPALARHVRVLAARQGKSRSRLICEVLERVLSPVTDQTDSAQADQRDTQMQVQAREVGV